MPQSILAGPLKNPINECLTFQLFLVRREHVKELTLYEIGDLSSRNIFLGTILRDLEKEVFKYSSAN